MLEPKLHLSDRLWITADLLWICCTVCFTTNPQQIERAEFWLYVAYGVGQRCVLRFQLNALIDKKQQQ